jgi:hypothetical protein
VFAFVFGTALLVVDGAFLAGIVSPLLPEGGAVSDDAAVVFAARLGRIGDPELRFRFLFPDGTTFQWFSLGRNQVPAGDGVATLQVLRRAFFLLSRCEMPLVFCFVLF